MVLTKSLRLANFAHLHARPVLLPQLIVYLARVQNYIIKISASIAALIRHMRILAIAKAVFLLAKPVQMDLLVIPVLDHYT